MIIIIIIVSVFLLILFTSVVATNRYHDNG